MPLLDAIPPAGPPQVPWGRGEPQPPLGVSADASACLHTIREDLGGLGIGALSRCSSCGLVIVERAGRTWAVVPPGWPFLDEPADPSGAPLSGRLEA